jgi:hypothetical protein
MMESEHLLLGSFREDSGLMNRFVPGMTDEMVWEQIQREVPDSGGGRTVPRASTAGRSTSISLEYASLLH